MPVSIWYMWSGDSMLKHKYFLKIMKISEWTTNESVRNVTHLEHITYNLYQLEMQPVKGVIWCLKTDSHPSS